jgi:hypothetical protein
LFGRISFWVPSGSETNERMTTQASGSRTDSEKSIRTECRAISPHRMLRRGCQASAISRTDRWETGLPWTLGARLEVAMSVSPLVP